MEPGAFITLSLVDPAEHFWGRLLRLTEAGVLLRGIDVGQIEKFKFQFNGRQRQVFPQTVFFPMRRVQQVNLDEATGDLLSVIDAVVRCSGLNADEIMQ